MIEAYYRMEGD